MTSDILNGGGYGPFNDLPPDRGEWLANERAAMDRSECPWLLELARFDKEGGWALYGQLTVVRWLMWRTDLARCTAYEKVRTARALDGHEPLREAYEEHRVTYSAVRAISRLKDPAPEVIEAMVELAETQSVAKVELAVRYYRDLAEQGLSPNERWCQRRFRVGGAAAGLRNLDGLVTETEGDFIDMAVNAFLDRLWRNDRHQAASGKDEPEFSGADTTEGEEAGPADTAAKSSGTAGSGEPEPADAPAGTDRPEFSGADTSSPSPPATRADAFMAIFEIAMRHISDLDHSVGTAEAIADRFMVHYLHHVDSGLTTRLDGSPVHPDVAGPIVCDATRVDHVVGDHGEPLSLGRKQRTWNTAQRRAITVRDGGRCRFPGCGNKTVQIHHVQHWEHGGPTNVTNGASLCPRHHTLHHAGFIIEGQPDGTLYFARPDGTPIGTTEPRRPGRPAVLRSSGATRRFPI